MRHYQYYPLFVHLDYREVSKYLDISALPSVSDELVRVALADTGVGVSSETMRCIRCTDEPVKALCAVLTVRKGFVINTLRYTQPNGTSQYKKSIFTIMNRSGQIRSHYCAMQAEALT